ncbi:MAG: extracellular solute-binding protein [Christensenellaceae bacterium]|nr:extracellular solute-binding protein [Christensenellaceae bacterium]
MKRILAMILCLMLALSTAAIAERDPLFEDLPELVELDLWVDWSWVGFDTYEGGVCQEWMIDQTGVKINMMKAIDSEQLSMMISSGDLPDLVVCSSSSKVRALSDSDVCYPLQELIDEFVPEWEISETEKAMNAYYSEDGKFYMLKNEYNTAEEVASAKKLAANFGQFHVRNDIYKALGSPEVKNEEDFFNLLALVREKYPDMVPLIYSPREYSAFGSMVGYNPSFPTDADGNLSMAIGDPAYKEMLRVINRLYREGYLSKENFSYTSDEQAFQQWYAGNAFMVTFFACNDEQVFQAKIREILPEAEVEQLPLLDNWAYTIPVSGWASLFITRSCKNPEAAIKTLYWAKQHDNSLALTYGVPGIDWEWGPEGDLVVLDRYKEHQKIGDVETFYRGLAFMLSADDYIAINQGYYAAATEPTRAIFDEVAKRAKVSNVISLTYPASNTDMGFLMDDISSLTNEHFTDICTAETEEDFEAQFEETLELAKDIGLDEINAYLSDTYKALCESMDAQ